MLQRVDELFARILSLNQALVEFDKSPHEARNEGIMLKPDVVPLHDVARRALREVAHIHPSDHSMHMMLSPTDCKLG